MFVLFSWLSDHVFDLSRLKRRKHLGLIVVLDVGHMSDDLPVTVSCLGIRLVPQPVLLDRGSCLPVDQDSCLLAHVSGPDMKKPGLSRGRSDRRRTRRITRRNAVIGELRDSQPGQVVASPGDMIHVGRIRREDIVNRSDLVHGFRLSSFHDGSGGIVDGELHGALGRVPVRLHVEKGLDLESEITKGFGFGENRPKDVGVIGRLVMSIRVQGIVHVVPEPPAPDQGSSALTDDADEIFEERIMDHVPGDVGNRPEDHGDMGESREIGVPEKVDPSREFRPGLEIEVEQDVEYINHDDSFSA